MHTRRRRLCIDTRH